MEHPYLLFPHLLLREEDLRALCLLLPRLEIFQVLRGPAVPSYAWEKVRSRPTIHDPEDLERIGLYLKGYLDFAERQGETGLLVCRSRSTLAGEEEESRFQIRGRIKEQESDEEDLKKRCLLEAAVFLETARNLDERVSEIASGLLEAQKLEDEFRRILGIEPSETTEEAMEVITPSLGSGNADFSYMILKRASCWYRLLSQGPAEPGWVPAIFSRQLLEEILEPLESEREKRGEDAPPMEVPLCGMPSPGLLSPEAFGSLQEELDRDGIRESFWKALDGFLDDPEDPLLLETLVREGSALTTRMEQWCEPRRGSGGSRVRLSLVRLKGCTHGDLWRSLDREGFSELGSEADFLDREALFLCLDRDSP